ncbi:MAG: PAS domain-containing protein [Pseudomonadota bacterium]|nr:PAS domain-containing protein [Pseudomonadota bacterium]
MIDDATFRLLADNVPTLCWVANGDGYIVWYNRRWHEYCGTTPEQMEGWGWQAVHDPELLPSVVERWTESVASGQPFEMTFPLRGADGVFRPFLTRIQPVRDATGAIARWFGVNTENFDQVAAEAALRAERDRSRGVLEGMAEGFVLLDREFRILDINAEGLRIDQRPLEAILGQTHWEAWPGTEDAEQGRLYKRVMAERTSGAAEVHYTWEDGHEVWVEVRAYPHPEGVAIFYREIGDRKRAEKRIRDSEAYTRLLLDSTSEAFYAVDREGVTTLCNQSFLRMLGFASQDAVVGRKLHDIIHHSHPDGSPYPSRECPIYHAASQGRPAFVNDEVFFRLDGTAFPVEYRAEPIMRDGELQGAICTFTDITERHKAEARQLLFLSLADRLRELSASREIVAVAVEMLGRHLGVSRVGYGEVCADGETIVYQTDYADGVAHLVGSFPIDAFGRENIAELRRGLTTTYADVTADPRTSEADFAAIETCSAMAVPLVREGRLRAALYLNHRDVREWTPDEVTLVQDVAARTWDALERARAEAELRELNATLERRVEERTAELLFAEEALRQAQKMEAVGQLTGGIAHDFNNMLAVVIGSLDLLGRRVGASDPRARRYIDAATDGARRAALLTQRLLAFSRQQPLQPEPVDANKLVTGMTDLLRGSLGGDIRLETVLAGGQWRTHADPNQLENVLLNLAVNARDAMPEGGRLTIETQNAHLDARYAAVHLGVPAGQYVLIAVTDTGAGMPPDVIAKAFDPFFTTKEIGKGTGLGLSQVYGFVKQSGGHVKIYSEPGQGTTVKIYLPRFMTAEGEADEEVSGPDMPLGERDEVVLVVEDEPAVRQFTVDALGELGYRVLEADGAQVALRLLDAHPEIALLFTDVVMPDVNGRKLADEARRRRPDLKVLFTTGYTRNAVVHNGVLDPGVELIGKPFTIEELAAKVREVLDGPLAEAGG